jgi:hypothetical protein
MITECNDSNLDVPSWAIVTLFTSYRDARLHCHRYCLTTDNDGLSPGFLCNDRRPSCFLGQVGAFVISFLPCGRVVTAICSPYLCCLYFVFDWLRYGFTCMFCIFFFIFNFLFGYDICALFLFESDFIVWVVYVRFEGTGWQSGVGKRVDADASASFTPRVAISLQEQFDTGCQTVSRSAAASVLRANVSFIADDDVSQTVEVLSFQL